jgi:hypothetical protein
MSTATESTSLVRVPVAETALATIEAIAMECSLVNANGASHMTKALKMAAGIKALRRAMSNEVMQEIMELQGSSLGFRTDKDTGNGYPVEAVKECAIEHLLRGGHLVGNEMNIIASRAYQTKEFFTRMLRVFPGLTDLRLHPGVPVLGGGGALVPYSATWKLFGEPDRIDRQLTKLQDGTQLDERICVKVNQGMGADAILGKAERKIKAAIYNRLTGSSFTEADPDDPVRSARAPVQTLEGLADKLEEKPVDENKPLTIDGYFADCATLRACEDRLNELFAENVDASEADLRAACESRKDVIKGRK